MFTGIVTEQGVVSSLNRIRAIAQFQSNVQKISKRVEERCQCCSQWSLSDFKKGSSEMLQFDVIDETLSLTNLKQIKKVQRLIWNAQ